MTKATTPHSSEPYDVTVIVAAWNRASMVGRALASIEAQPRPPRAVIVVDDASTDDTGAVVKDWIASHSLPVTLLTNDENRGVAETRNAGLRQATTRYAAFLDSDDIWLPHALETLTDPLEANANAVLCCADARVVGNTTDDLPAGLFAPRLDRERDIVPAVSRQAGLFELTDPAGLMLLTSIIPTCSAVFRLDAARDAGWMPDFRTGEDWLFWLSLAKRGRFLCRLEPVAEVLRHGDNLTHASRDTFTAREHLRALLALRDGSLGISLSVSERARVDHAIIEKTGHWRYFLSKQGWGNYWRGLSCAEGQATGGRMRHFVADPKSIARALLANPA